MTIVGALYAGVAGLGVTGEAIQIIGDNIANINTVGFKASRADFSDLLSQTLTGSALNSQIGRGVMLGSISNLFSQGSFQSSSIGTDMAINGDGFFAMTDGSGTFYTRAGQFRLNNQGELVNAGGLKVIGYQYDNEGQNTGITGAINLSSLTTPPNPTGDGVVPGSGITLHCNLNANAETPAGAWDKDNAALTSNFSTSITTYDSLGGAHDVTVYYRKEAATAGPPAIAENSWSWHAVIDGSEINGGTAGVNQERANGMLVFTSTGALDREIAMPAGPIASDWDFVGGCDQNQVIGFDFGDSITTDGGTGLAGSTQFSGDSFTNYQTQDGFSSGNLRGINVDTSGTITGIFSNGRTRDVGKLAIATFPTTSGLYKIGSNLLIQTNASGAPTLSEPGVGSAGKLAASTLELSNVDLASEFVNLINYQRAYQADSKIISTGDQLLQQVVNIIR